MMLQPRDGILESDSSHIDMRFLRFVLRCPMNRKIMNFPWNDRLVHFLRWAPTLTIDNGKASALKFLLILNYMINPRNSTRVRHDNFTTDKILWYFEGRVKVKKKFMTIAHHYHWNASITKELHIATDPSTLTEKGKRTVTIPHS